jgi:glycosyltransferase involved in cell wall biosynthesis
MLPKYTKICISTQHPGMGGGIGRIVDNLSDYLLKNKLSPKLAFSKNIVPSLLFNESTENKIRNQKLVRDAVTTRTYLPLYYPNAILYGKILKKRVSSFGICHQIGGNCLEATPFLYAKRRYICWTATTFLDEWKRVYNPGDKTRFASWMLRKINNSQLNAIRKLEKKLYENATIINPISTRTAEMIKKEFGIDESKINIIPPPIDFKELLSKKKPEFKIDFDYLLFVGRLDRRKNIEVLLKAFAQVSKKFKELKLVILGDGPERVNLENLSRCLGVADKVVFTGFVDDEAKRDYLMQAKLFTLSSTQEGFGIVLVESLALGVPVVSTDCGGPADIIENGKTGYLTKIGDHKKFAEKIEHLLSEDETRKKFGIAGKKTAQERFSIERIGKIILKEYELVK